MKEDTKALSLFSKDELPVSAQRQFVDEWHRVEKTLKALEHYEGVLFVPSYIGLRNSGRHFVDALSKMQSSDRVGAEASLGRAVEELRRSRHDALRALINYCHFKLLLIEENFGTERVFQVCPEYFDIRDRIEDVNTRLNEDFPDFTSADAYFNDLEESYLPRLLLVFERTVRAKTAALDAIKEKDQRENRYKTLALVGFGVGVVGLVLAVAAFFI
jgi:hypothetical protein